MKFNPHTNRLFTDEKRCLADSLPVLTLPRPRNKFKIMKIIVSIPKTGKSTTRDPSPAEQAMIEKSLRESFCPDTMGLKLVPLPKSQAQK